MWLIVFMVGVVVPFMVWGFYLTWRDHKIEKENEDAALHKVG
ncbi:hypothetical protein AGMMS50230_08040 [Spirochaetia bacterium]|nr:hypothetical protein AGMMS50230_08040 [Spirochaetia bacterium]